MAHRDTWATCEKCGTQFVFTVEVQRQLADSGADVTPPAQCPQCRRQAGTAPRQQAASLGEGPFEGVVKWYDTEKGYGFIKHPDGSDIFFHRSGIAPGGPERFADGVLVTYLVEETEKGLQAVEVAPLS